jgi:hypothetical protein
VTSADHCHAGFRLSAVWGMVFSTILCSLALWPTAVTLELLSSGSTIRRFAIVGVVVDWLVDRGCRSGLARRPRSGLARRLWMS